MRIISESEVKKDLPGETVACGNTYNFSALKHDVQVISMNNEEESMYQMCLKNNMK